MTFKALSSGKSPLNHPPIPAESVCHPGLRPFSCKKLLKTASAIGDRQMFPENYYL